MVFYVAIRKFGISELNVTRNQIFEKYKLESLYLLSYAGIGAAQNFLNSPQNYWLLQGMKANLYKCFLPKAWEINNNNGITSLLHPEGIYDDPKGDVFRKEIYQRLLIHFQFHNELTLFKDVGHNSQFSINVYRKKKSSEINFLNISNLFSPATVDFCFSHDGIGTVEGIKDENNKWNIRGHKDRIIKIKHDELDLFSNIFSCDKSHPLYTRLPAIQANTLIDVFHKIANYPCKLDDLSGRYFSSVMFDEAKAQREGILKKKTEFPEKINTWILSGPHFFVGNPFYKTPRRKCINKADYDILDLSNLPEKYIPRSNFVPVEAPADFTKRIPKRIVLVIRIHI